MGKIHSDSCVTYSVKGAQRFSIYGMQAMPQLTDRSKLPNIVDPVIKNTMDLKHLHQVCGQLIDIMFPHFTHIRYKSPDLI